MPTPPAQHRYSFFAILLICALISACKGGRDSALDDRIKADKELLQKEHAILQVRMDSLTNRYFALEATRAKDPQAANISSQDLDRADIGLGDMKAIIEGDERFIREHAAACDELFAGKVQPEPFITHYDEMMQGHSRMLEEFHAMADKLEQNILKPR